MNADYEIFDSLPQKLTPGPFVAARYVLRDPQGTAVYEYVPTEPSQPFPLAADLEVE